jgi:SAM-dependent methyltransferase
MILATQIAQIRPVHPFPARMAPSIVWDALPEQGAPIKILDPMSGSGTTLVCARLKGHYAIGYDTDPLALLISRAWCADVYPEGIKNRAELVLERSVKLSKHLRHEKTYPNSADAETRHFIDFWFDPENRRDLTALATCISRIRSDSERNFLWCAFSRMVITKISGVSLAMDISHSRPHRVYDVAPVKPFNIFLKAVATVVNNSPFSTNSNSLYPANIKYGDARSLPVESASVDMIITSPPYLNAIDYLRGHKLSLVWMGLRISEIRALRSDNIGSEVPKESPQNAAILNAMESMADLGALDNRHLGMIRRYVWDMNKVMKECARVLKRSGRAIFVIGDSDIRGIFVKNSEALIHLANSNNLSLSSRICRPIETGRRYLPPPESKNAGGKMNGRMKEEVILEFHF